MADWAHSALVKTDSASLSEVLRQRVLDWMYTLFTHNQNETQAILRAATATGYGLDPSKYVSTFPGSTVNMVITPPMATASDATTSPPPTPGVPASPPDAKPLPAAAAPAAPPTPPPTPPSQATPARGWPPWAKALAAVGLTAGGVGLGWGVGSLMTKSGAPATPPTQATPAPAPAPGASDRNWMLRLPDGTNP